MFMEFSDECQRIFLQAKKEMLLLKHPYVGSEHFLLAILKNKNHSITKEFAKSNIDYKIFRGKLLEVIGYGTEENDWFLFTPLFKRIIESTILEAKDNNNKSVTVNNLFLALLEEGEGIAVRILMSLGVDIDVFYGEYLSFCKQSYKKKQKKSIFNEFGEDLVSKALNNEFDPVLGREDDIEIIIETLLRRKKNNPLLIGKAGVGKTAIVEELARRIACGDVPFLLKNKHIISISMSSLVSGTKYRGEFEERINKLITELKKNREYIVFIDEIHTLVGAGGAEGAIDASNIFKPALSRGDISIIGATTEAEYRKYIESAKALERRFQNIVVEEPDVDKTFDILKSIKSIYEIYYNIEIKNDVLKKLVELSEQYIFSNQQPDKSIEVLDSACCRVSLIKTNSEKKIVRYKNDLKDIVRNKNDSILNNDFEKASNYLRLEKQLEDKINRAIIRNNCHKRRVLTLADVIKAVEEKSGIKIYKMNNKKINLKEKLNRCVFGQEKTIDILERETFRKLQGFKYNKKPLSFLFVGPTGVGKTYLAECYNKFLNGNKELIRIDMSEYRDCQSISKLLGSSAGYVGYNDGNNVFNQIKLHPDCVLLLDEIEKADKAVINLFLQILDNGRIKDAKGDSIRFDHVIIIMTSNLGFGKNTIGFNKNINDKLFLELKSTLGTEFINRVNNICVFSRLSEDVIDKIIDMKLKEYRKFYNDLNIKLRLSKEIKSKIKKDSLFEEFGARKIEQILDSEIDVLMNDNIKRYISVN